MNAAMALYLLALSVLVIGAMVATLHPRIPVDPPVVATMGAGAMFALIGMEAGEPPNWLVGMVCSWAVGCLYVGVRWLCWLRCRSSARERLLRRLREL